MRFQSWAYRQKNLSKAGFPSECLHDAHVVVLLAALLVEHMCFKLVVSISLIRSLSLDLSFRDRVRPFLAIHGQILSPTALP